MPDIQESIGDLEIEPYEWISFLDCFSRQHEGWMASIEVATAAGNLREVKDRRLRGVSIDHAHGHQRAYVEVGDPPDECVTHIVSMPTHIMFKRRHSGAHEGLDIASADGTKTLVRFRSPILPEMIDDIAS